MPINLFQREKEKNENERQKTFLLHAGIGAGKTLVTAKIAETFFNMGFDNIIIFAPSIMVKEDWVPTFQQSANIAIKSDWDCSYNYLLQNTFQGVSLTYNALTPINIAMLLKVINSSKNTLLVYDECHHLSDKNIWGWGSEQIWKACGACLMLTGTPFRSDEDKIPFVTYEPWMIPGQWKLKTDYSYSYREAIQDKICAPLRFSYYGVKKDGITDGILKKDIHREIYNAIIDPSASDIPFKLCNRAYKKLLRVQKKMHRAAMLIVTKSVSAANILGDQLQNAGLKCKVITSEDCSSADIKDFANGPLDIVITVRMIAEGVNIPRLRVVVYLSDYLTYLFFEQVGGRIVRNRNDELRGGLDYAYFFLLKYEPLMEHAKRIEDDIRHIIEEQRKQFIGHPGGGGPKGILNIDFNADLENEGAITAGEDMSFLDTIREYVPEELFEPFERDYAEKLQTKKESTFTMPTKMEQIKRIKDEIIRITAAIVRSLALDMEKSKAFKFVHGKLNKDSDMTNQPETDNLILLNRKLENAKRWLKDIQGN
jgi:superfamily II DNA or RNA helicase